MRTFAPTVVLLLLLLITAACRCTAALAEETGNRTGRWQAAAARLGPSDAAVLAGPDGRVLWEQNADSPMVPASTLKLLTALAGFEILGRDYRFPTDFYTDAGANLKIQGFGDPLLISEVVAEIAAALAQRLGPGAEINDLVLDDAYFAEPLVIPGVSDSNNPYDAPNGALCVNFNTVLFRRNADGRLVSGESQTPLLPVAVDRIQKSRLQAGRIVLSHENRESLDYAGRLFVHFLEAAGVAVRGEVVPGRVDAERDRFVFRHRSPFDLAQVVGRLLEFSNNFMANQILIAAGAKRFGPPGTLDKGVQAVADFAARRLGFGGLQLVEGSGISRANRMTARQLLTVLAHFHPDRHLLPREGRFRYKTGTLAGIRTRAGYLESSAGVHPFVILINRTGPSAEAVMREMARAID